MDKVTLSLLIDKLTSISQRLYNEESNGVEISFEIDEIIDNLNGWLDYLPIAPKYNEKELSND